MSRPQLHVLAAALCLVSAGTLAVAAADRMPLRRDAETLKQKVAAIGSRSVTARQPARTTVTERELNAYLAYEMAGDFPAGVVEPSVAIIGAGRLSGRAIVDLDLVRKERNPTSLLDPFYYMAGRLPVAATGVLRTTGGIGRFELESADVAGVPIPKLVLQQIVTFYSRAAGYPSGLSLDDPFELPARIQEIRVDSGQAIVVQ